MTQAETPEVIDTPVAYEAPVQSLINAALAAFQADIPPIGKDRTVTIKPKDKPEYRYAYAQLDVIIAAVAPRMATCGLSFTSFTQLTERGNMILVCQLRHTSGEYIEGVWPVAVSGDPKAMGSAMTYGRRYLLLGFLGVAPADSDDDGAIAAAAKKEPFESATPVPTLLDLLQQARPHFASRDAFAAAVSAEFGKPLDSLGLADRVHAARWLAGLPAPQQVTLNVVDGGPSGGPE